MSKKNLALAVAPAALSLLLVLGVTTVFSACHRREDGTWMHCHQCQNTVAAGGVGLVALFGTAAFVKNNRGVRIVLQLLAVIASVVLFFVPGGICPMCMMKNMRCYTVFQPFTRVMTVLIALSGAGALTAAAKRGERVVA